MLARYRIEQAWTRTANSSLVMMEEEARISRDATEMPPLARFTWGVIYVAVTSILTGSASDSLALIALRGWSRGSSPSVRVQM